MPEAEVPATPWVARENRRFIKILGGMDEAAWRRPTCCAGWTAADVVAHMTLGARFYAHVIRAGAGGALSMPFGAENLEAFWAYRKKTGDELAALAGSERVDRFEAAVSDLQEVFENLRPGDLDREAWHWMRPCPIRSFPGQRLYELILHDWDIRNRPEADLHPDALGMGVDILNERLPFFYNLRPAPGLAGRFRFETENPGRVWALEIRAERAASDDPGDGAFDARFFTSASDIILLTTGRADLRAKEAAGRLRVEGDRARAEALLDVLCRPF